MIVVVEIIKTWLNIVNLREFDTGYIVVTIMQISTIRSENIKYVWLTELIQRSNIHS
jgi:recombinational DNA repair protein RecR